MMSADRDLDIAPNAGPSWDEIAADGAVKLAKEVLVQPAPYICIGYDPGFEIADALGEQWR